MVSIGGKGCWCITYKEWLVRWEMALGGNCPSPPSLVGAPRPHIGLLYANILYLTAFAVVKPIAYASPRSCYGIDCIIISMSVPFW